MKFLRASYALSAIASLVPGTVGNSSATSNKIFVTSVAGTDVVVEYQSTDGSGAVQVTQNDLPGSSGATTSLDFVDMDGDGDLDLIRGGMGGAVWIHINDGSDNFPANDMITLPSTGVASYYSIHGVDVDNDGDIDIVGTSQSHGSWLWLNEGGNTFAAGTQFSTVADSLWISAAADFNGDGYIDFIVGNQIGKPQVYINNGSGGFPSSYDLGDITGSRAVSPCDFNQDGHMDVVVTYSTGQNNRVYLNSGQSTDTPAFTEVILPHINGADPQSNGCADLDGDGYPGAANPVGSFPTKADLSTSDFPSWVIALGDLDGDGDIDVYSADRSGPRNIYLNNRDGMFGSGQSFFNAGFSFAGAFMYTAASEPAPASPTASPSKTPTGSPLKAPSGSPQTASPTNTQTRSPTQGPSPVADSPSAPSSAPADSLYFPDWTMSNGGCKTGGGQPPYMTLDPSTWMLASLDECCARYYSWMLDDCEGASGAAPSGLWYPDWAGGDDTCKDDGSEPSYMALNPDTWMHSSKQECCEAKFSWTLNECLGSGAGSTNEWYIDWILSKCKQDCVDTGPSCGGRAESWDQLFETRSACCAEMAAWNPTECLVD
ncbi:hypothetical protein THAOC_35902 [Thalassiosira oceanica]|uniref:Uncharacterized protein n=1 Tax=Thalassiosira oceanica TaxID=159749 RepID=K0R990_THAOC|nr:hypothetical protein THAOC_35902 [Thalassiosira oceanica]|eukprot:EJK45481.1 hypothetical protein THAOC_35902 [Thalassiosira oceanica]